MIQIWSPPFQTFGHTRAVSSFLNCTNTIRFQCSSFWTLLCVCVGLNTYFTKGTLSQGWRKVDSLPRVFVATLGESCHVPQSLWETLHIGYPFRGKPLLPISLDIIGGSGLLTTCGQQFSSTARPSLPPSHSNFFFFCVAECEFRGLFSAHGSFYDLDILPSLKEHPSLYRVEIHTLI